MPEQFTVDELNQLSRDPSLSPEERTEVLHELQNLLAKPSPDWDELGFGDKVRKVGNRAGQVLELGAGLPFVPPPFRIPGVLAGIGLQNASKGEPLTEGMGTALALEAVGPGVGTVKRLRNMGRAGLATSMAGEGGRTLIPRLMSEASLRAGGMRGPQASRTAKAFVNEWKRSPLFGSIKPGQANMMAQRSRQVGGELAEAARKSPNKVDILKAVTGADDAVKPQFFGHVDAPQLGMEATEDQIKFLSQYGQPASMEDALRLKRAQQKAGRKLIRARAGADLGADTASNQAGQMMAAERGRRIAGAVNDADPGIAAINERLSDLKIMEESLKRLRGGGGVLGELGGIGTRGGLGYGMSRVLPAAVGYGLGGPAGAAIGAAAGFGLNPRIAHSLGFMGGNTAAATPTLMRLLELYELSRKQQAGGEGEE